MRKMMITAVALLASVSVFADKVGFVNSQEAFMKYSKTQTIQENLAKEKERLENQIKQKTTREQQEKSIIFLESRDDVHDIMQAFDLFLFPSLFEGLPVTMVEAQAAGLKCFISDKIPQECILTDNVEVIGLSENARQWAKKILGSMKDFERKDTYQEIRKKNFDIKKNAEWLEEFYLNERGE